MVSQYLSVTFRYLGGLFLINTSKCKMHERSLQATHSGDLIPGKTKATSKMPLIAETWKLEYLPKKTVFLLTKIKLHILITRHFKEYL